MKHRSVRSENEKEDYMNFYIETDSSYYIASGSKQEEEEKEKEKLIKLMRMQINEKNKKMLKK